MLPHEAWWNLLLQSLVHIDFVYNNPRGILNWLRLCSALSHSLTGHRHGNASLQTTSTAPFPLSTRGLRYQRGSFGQHILLCFILWLPHIQLHFEEFAVLRLPRLHKYWLIISQHPIKLYQLLVKSGLPTLGNFTVLKAPCSSLNQRY